MKNMTNAWLWVLALLVVVGFAGCAKKARPLVPLALDYSVTPQAVTLTEQGTQAYQARQFEQAKQYFSQAVTAAPQSGQAHYNYALTLNALGDVDDARQHFIEAANLAPDRGDVVELAAATMLRRADLEAGLQNTAAATASLDRAAEYFGRAVELGVATDRLAALWSLNARADRDARFAVPAGGLPAAATTPPQRWFFDPVDSLAHAEEVEQPQ